MRACDFESYIFVKIRESAINHVIRTSGILVPLLSNSESSITGIIVGRPCAHRLGNFVNFNNFIRDVHCSRVSLSPNLMAPEEISKGQSLYKIYSCK